MFGIVNGYFGFEYSKNQWLFGPDNPWPGITFFKFAFHPPLMGGPPNLQVSQGSFSIAIPIWLYLSVIIGAIVLREKRRLR